MGVTIEAKAKRLIDLIKPILEQLEGVGFRQLKELYNRVLQVAPE
jgi:predicted nucleic acid-binding protein